MTRLAAQEKGEVSIPQSGFGAFELEGTPLAARLKGTFQSLSRDSGRLNFEKLAYVPPRLSVVSIPQSGFGAFELYRPGNAGC